MRRLLFERSTVLTGGEANSLRRRARTGQRRWRRSGKLDWKPPIEGRRRRFLSSSYKVRPLREPGNCLRIRGIATGRQAHGPARFLGEKPHENDFDDEHVDLQLAHMKRNKVSAAYNHAKYLKQRTVMMQWWADYLDGQLAHGRKVFAA